MLECESREAVLLGRVDIRVTGVLKEELLNGKRFKRRHKSP